MREICVLAQRAFDPEGRVSIAYETERGAPLPASRLSALGLLVNEAIVNSLKYAHPTGIRGHIRLVCRPMFGDGLMVMIEDDGVGLPDYLEPESGGGLGLSIMRSLAGQLDATLHFRSSPLGLTVQVVVTL